jgi:hypothetical protein
VDGDRVGEGLLDGGGTVFDVGLDGAVRGARESMR